ncbi:MAG TPA: carboxypeptidase regulatory-like domain-containing protein, partial [Nitrospiraceae bacterium]
IVRDTTGAPLADAEVIVLTKRFVTNPQGSFRLDSIPLGPQFVTIRRIGYSSFRSTINVRETSRYEFVLVRAAYVLPAVYARAPRLGVYGTVGDTNLAPLSGVIVQLAGRGPQQTVSDSNGRFAFSTATAGLYVVRVVHPGFAEERLFLEVTDRDGVEIALRLRRSFENTSLVDEVALRELSTRLVANLADDRVSPAQLSRYGSLSLCEVNRIAQRIGRGTDSLAIILNGVSVLEGRSLRDLCSWQAAEVQLIEFGENICRDVTRTLVDMMNAWCTSFTGEQRRASRISTQRAGMPFIVIWETNYQIGRRGH